jgi:cell division protein FtsZ
VIYEAVDQEANIIFGAMVDPKMQSEISITVLATGFGLGVDDIISPSKPTSTPTRPQADFSSSSSTREDAPSAPSPAFRVARKPKKAGGVRGFIRKLFG